MENIYNQYTNFVRQSVLELNNQQLLTDLRPRFERLKQKVSENEYTLETYKGVKSAVLNEIENNISNGNSLDNFIMQFDSTIYDINNISNDLRRLLQQPKLSNSLRNRITSYQNDWYRSLNLTNTQSAINQISEFQSTFYQEEQERKVKQKKLILQILKWTGIAAAAGIVIWIITSFWQIIVGIIVLAAIGGLISLFSNK